MIESKVISVPLEPTDKMLEAMALERARQEKANGHGKYGYRDLYIAALKAAPVRGADLSPAVEAV